jgi:hypothetical protein
VVVGEDQSASVVMSCGDKQAAQFTISSIGQNLPGWMFPSNLETDSHTSKAQCCVFIFLTRSIATDRGSPLKVGRTSN